MKRTRVALLAMAVVGLLCWSVPSAFGQRKLGGVPPRGFPRGLPGAADPDNPDAESLADGVFLPPDRTAKRRLEQARENLHGAQPDYAESVKVLGALLESGEDYFFRPDPNQPVYHSLKAEAGRLIAEMPREGQGVYELTFGATARRTLDDAAAAGDMAKISEVSRRFFYTEAGWEATVLVARNHLDHGSPLAAALSFQRLTAIPAAAKRLEPMLSLSLATCWARGGMPEKAKEVLDALKKKYPDAKIRQGDGYVPAFSADALAFLTGKSRQPAELQPELAQWTLFRGDPGRNAASAGGGPLLSARWRQPTLTLDNKSVETKIGQLRQSFLDQDIVALPSAHPLAVGKFVVMRRPDGVCGVEFTTGKLRWQYLDVSFDKLLDAAHSQPNEIMSTVQQRTWDDATYGTMSSDGESVYYVDNLASSSISFAMPGKILPNGRRLDLGPKTSNCLVARDLGSEGALRWYVGTDSQGEVGSWEPKLADTFFLGPPLPLAGHLYVLAETQGQEIRLDVLSARDGHREWSQQLAVVDQETLEPVRRTAGATPSFADGVLVCPTSSGAVVGVDLATRSLLWGYQYLPNSPTALDRMQALRMGRGIDPEQRVTDRWVDATATVVDGRVVVTPIESDGLFCVNLLDGRLHWKQERGNNLYVACVQEGNVIVVGHKRVSAFKLSDGTPAWQTPLELPPGSMPSGRGYHSGKFYYLPLSTAEVAKIDLVDGRIESRAKSRHGEVPGNLVCFRGEVVSQAPEHLETFYQLESLKQQVAETLKKDPDGPKALAQLGQIKLDENKLQEAIGLFRRAYELDHGDTSRDLLIDSLLDGLRLDFAGSRQAAQELEGLIARKPQQTKFLRYMAMGLQRSGETLAAFQAYLKLLDQEPLGAELDEANESLLARRDRWIQGQLARLRSTATPEEQRDIDAVVETRLKKALAAPAGKPQIAALREFLHVFGAHSAADEAREQLATRLTGKDTLLEREQLLRHLEALPQEAANQPAVSRRATARLALLFDEAGRPEFSAIYYRKLLERWKDTECLDGQTGKKLVEQLDAKGPVRKLLDDAKPWPPNLAGVSEDKDRTSHQTIRLVDLEIQGKRAPFFDDVNVALDPQQKMIVGRDGLGHERFRISLAQKDPRQAFAFTTVNSFHNPLNFVSVNGNLLLLSLGYQVLAIDTLRGSEMASRVLWSQDLIDQAPGMHMARLGMHARPLVVGWGPPRIIANDAAGRPIGAIGPLNDGGVCFQRLRELMCVHPLTGDTLWTRKNLPAGSDLFGDEEFLFVVPPDGSPALVLSAINGELLGLRSVPPQDQRMATIGRFLLVWTNVDGVQSLALLDPWQEGEQRTVWTRKFAPDSKAWVVPQEAVGVLEPNGAFVLLNLPDGKPLVKEQLQPEKALKGIYVLRSAEQYLLVTDSPPEKVVAAAEPGGPNNPLITGRVYAFSRATGKKMWPEPVVVNQFGLVLSQPSELPVLAFMRHVTSVGGAGMKASVMCIDKRTGATLYRNDSLSLGINNYEFGGDREHATATLRLPGMNIVMRFTDDPVKALGSTGGAGKAARGAAPGQGDPRKGPNAPPGSQTARRRAEAQAKAAAKKENQAEAGKGAKGKPEAPQAKPAEKTAKADDDDPFGDNATETKAAEDDDLFGDADMEVPETDGSDSPDFQLPDESVDPFDK